MATAAGDSTGYGGGAGGKFRRRPFRRPQTTPYDRPPTALRITRRNDDRSSSVGWLSRIVDPASKLITASAHKLFSSVFRKRLLPPPPQPSQDEGVEPLENHLGDAMTEAPSRIQERHAIEGNTHNGSMSDGVAELEDILKQKTFTKSEIDRLTVLLHSKKVDKTATEPPASHSRQNELRGTAFENRFNPFEVSGADLTPAVRPNVNVGGVASPTELAKAYMGSMSTRVSPSMLGSHSQAIKEGTPSVTTHRSSVYTVQKSLTPAENSHKDFVVPRSRGRSAIHSMARTPYSRVQQTATKGLGTSNGAFDGNSLLSSQKTLKRRSSVLENDIGSVGPIRRIRQKPNLLYPKNLGLPSSSTSSTIATPSGVGEASSKSHEDRGEKDPFSSSHVSSMSIEMGQRILQELEKLTPPKDKSNEKKPGLSGGVSGMELTPSMLSGLARKSLETLDSLKYVQSDVVCGKVVDSWNALREAQDSTTKEQDKLNDNSSQMLMNSSSKVYHENGNASSTDHDVMGITNNTAPVVFKSIVDVPKRSPAFQMSAYEDDLDMDDDAFATPSVNEGKRNLSESSVQSNGKLPEHPFFAEATKADRPAFPVVESSLNSALKNATTVDASNTAEKGIDHDFKDSVSNKKIGSSIPSLQPVQTSVSDRADIPASTISFGLKSSDKVSPPSFISSSAAESSSVKDVSSSVFAFGAASADAAVKSPGSNISSVEAVDLLKKADNAPTSLPGSSISTIGSFGSFPLTSAASSLVMFSSPSSFSVSATKVGADAVDSSATATAPINGGSNSVTTSVAFPSFQSTFRGSSLDSDSAGKSKGTDLGNSTSSNLLGEASVPAQGSAVASFQFGAPTTSGNKSQAEASDNVSIFGDQTLPPTTASASTTEPSVSNTGSLASASALFSSSFAFGSSTSGSSSMAAFGSVSSASTNIFGGSPQSSSSPVFGSALSNSPSGLSFGASAPSSSSTSSAFSFGTSSMSAPANGSSAVAPSGSVSSGFTFGTSSISAPANGASNGASSTSSSTASGAPSSTFLFGASPATASSTPSSTFSFGATATSSAPSSTFSFGASPASAASGAPSSTFSFGASASSGAPSSPFSFGASSASSSAPSSAFSFGASSAPPTSSSSSTPSSTFLFGASSATAPAPVFPFGSAAAPTPSTSLQPSQPAFGTSSVFGFGSSSPLGNNDQMSMEDSMVEDSMHQSPTIATPTPVFGQSPTSNFSFGMAQPQPQAPTQLGASPFQFGGQQNQVAASPNPFQASGSFDGGSFSLGAGGNDKSNRRIVKVKGRNRKK